MEFILSQQNPNELPPIVDLLLEMQRGLFGAVSSALRAMCVDIDEKEEMMHFYYFYDGEIDDELFELASVATTEAFFSPYSVEQHILQLNSPQKIPVKGRLAYLRKGEELPIEYQKEKKYKDIPGLTLRGQILLEIQQALLGKAFPALRRIYFTISEEQKSIHLYLYYDGEISQADKYLAEEVLNEATESISGYRIEKQIARVDFPLKDHSPGEICAFARYEKP